MSSLFKLVGFVVCALICVVVCMIYRTSITNGVRRVWSWFKKAGGQVAQGYADGFDGK